MTDWNYNIDEAPRSTTVTKRVKTKVSILGKNDMTKVAYNNCYGGFTVSRVGILLGRKLSGNPEWGGACIIGDTYSDGEAVDFDYGGGRDIDRSDPVLIEVIETLGEKASGSCSCLAIEDVPSGTAYRIDEYDGNESVMTNDDYDWKIA